MLLKKYNYEDYLFLDPVEIKSPEQFVPLFVANHTPFAYTHYHHILITESIDIRVPITDTFEEDREKIKVALLHQLNHPYPKSYSLPVLKDLFLHSDSISRLPSEAFPGVILGDDWEERASTNGIYHLGCWLTFNSTSSSLTSPPSKVFPFEATVARSQPVFKKTIIPHILFVVKAKRIPYIRARILLDLPLSIPLTDIKMLRNSNDAAGLPSEVSKYIKSLQPTVEYLTADEIMPYLIGPETEKKYKPGDKLEAISKVQSILQDPTIVKPVMEYA